MTSKPQPQEAFGIVSTDVVKTLSGLDFLAAIMAGTYPLPPICRVLDFRPVEMEVGRAVFEGVPRGDFYNPLGSVHGGYAATLLDSAMGCAVHTTLRAGVGYTTLEFKINFVRPLSERTGKVRAEARVLHTGTTIGTAEGKLIDARGKTFAHATTTCLIFALP